VKRKIIFEVYEPCRYDKMMARLIYLSICRHAKVKKTFEAPGVFVLRGHYE
jgi:hypothetical protein